MCVTSPVEVVVEHRMFKRIINCEECGNDAIIYTDNKEEIGFCPFCGEAIITESTDIDDEDAEGLDDDDWPESG